MPISVAVYFPVHQAANERTNYPSSATKAIAWWAVRRVCLRLSGELMSRLSAAASGWAASPAVPDLISSRAARSVFKKMHGDDVFGLAVFKQRLDRLVDKAFDIFDVPARTIEGCVRITAR